ncbi:MAG: hypothetical protein EPN60_07190, partial [Nevskiaceae bacterium]
MPAAMLRFLLALSLLFATTVRAQTEPEEYRGMLAGHNTLRAKLGIAPLAWSAERAVGAQAWASQLAAQGCALRYSSDPSRRETTGENLLKAWSTTAYDGFKRTPAAVVERWSSEGLYYNHAEQRCQAPEGRQCGQYLQMIWETTTELGCGRARCADGEIWVCHYTPRGNQEGLKPYGNPPPEPVAPPEVLGCAIEDAMPAASPALSSPHLIPV